MNQALDANKPRNGPSDLCTRYIVRVPGCCKSFIRRNHDLAQHKNSVGEVAYNDSQSAKGWRFSFGLDHCIECIKRLRIW
jgi:hypothetical protein